MEGEVGKAGRRDFRTKSRLIRYGLGVAAAVFAVGIRLPLDPIVGNGRLAFVPLFAVLCFVGWYCGAGPAIVTLAIGAAATWSLILNHPDTTILTDLQFLAGLSLNVIFGALCAFLGVAMKTATKRAERRDRMLRETFESIAEAFIRVDHNWRYVYVNEEAERLLGRTRSELLGRVVWDLYPEMVGSEVYDAFHKASKEQVIVEVVEQHPLRQEWYSSRVYPTADGGVSVYCRNVTSQRQEAEAIRISESRYRGLANSGPHMTFLVEASTGMVLFASPQFLEYTGENIEGKDLNEVNVMLIHQEDLRAISQSYATVGPIDSLFRMKRHDGEYRWVQCYTVIIRNNQDEPSEYIGTIHDVHDQHELSEAMRRSAEQLRSIADSAPLSIAHCDRDCRYLFVNEQYAARLERRSEDLVGKSIAEVLGDEAFSSIRPYAEQALNGEKVEYQAEIHYQEPFGSRWIHALYVPQFDSKGLVYAFVVIVLDITDRRKAEEKLMASDVRYRAFISNSSEGIWRLEFDPPIDTSLSIDEQLDLAYRNGRMAELNQVMAEMYGMPNIESMIGSSINDMLPSSDPQARAYIRSIIENGYRVSEIESEEIDPKGNVLYFMNSMTGIIEDGKLLRIWGTQRDITAKKRVEQALQEADRRKDEFLATLAHELRNPLAPIATSVELLKHYQGDAAQIENARLTMERSVSHMIRLVDDLLDLSRITMDKMELRCEPIELAPVMKTAFDSILASFDCSQHEMTLELPEEPIYLVADAVRLGQVFGNLLTNACKYTHPGGRIRFSGVQEGSEIVVRVTDSGVGIPPEQLTYIFEMFAQLDSSFESSRRGLGIGLHLVKRVIDMHGGTVAATSQGVDKGSEFTIRLPISIPTAEIPLSPPKETVDNTGTKVLVVDDNQDAALTIARLLSIYGFDTEVAHDGVEAVEKTVSFAPDIVLMDIGLPKMNGHEACQEIRRRLSDRDIFIVALTGWGQDEDRQRSKEAGADAHLVKPVDIEKLLKTISKTVPA